MSDNPIPLDAQVVTRVRQFLQSTNISQRWLAREIGSDPGNFSAFLSGAKSLAATKMAKLLEILGLDRMQLQAKFSGPSVTARIEHFQSLDGKPMTLDASGGFWVPGQSGQDPNDDGTDDEQALLDKISGLHQQIIDKIKAYQDAYPQ
jgi:hypothetical protein